MDRLQSGILERLDKREIEAVAAHEAHPYHQQRQSDHGDHRRVYRCDLNARTNPPQNRTARWRE